MYALVLVQAAALSGCIVTVLTLVRFKPGVGPRVHRQLVFATEAFAANFTFMGLVTWRGKGKQSRASRLR